MSELSEKSRFESRFEEDIIEVAAIIGASGAGAGRAGKDILWTASIELIAWKNLSNNGAIVKEELRLKWIVDDEEWEKTQDVLKMNTVVRLLVRKGKNEMMLVKVLETSYIDNDLEVILEEFKKPVFYNDEVLGKFELNKSVKTFEQETTWAGEEGSLYFDWAEDTNVMKSALDTAHMLFKEQDQWNSKIREYAAEELVELANDWLQDDEDAEIDEITKEMFINFMKLDSISVYPEGDFEIFFFDGDMFWGHCIIVSGNINGEFDSAEIAG